MRLQEVLDSHLVFSPEVPHGTQAGCKGHAAHKGMMQRNIRFTWVYPCHVCVSCARCSDLP